MRQHIVRRTVVVQVEQRRQLLHEDLRLLLVLVVVLVLGWHTDYDID
jgi:hypothetical protein